MAIKQFSEDKVVRLAWDSGNNDLGSYEVQTKQNLQHVRMRIVSYGTKTGLEKLTLRFTDDINQTTNLATSSQLSIGDITDLGEYWFGWIRFDFNNEILPVGSPVYAWLDTQDYVYAVDNYIGLCLDYPVPVYDNGSTEYLGHPVELQFYGLE